jgi:hypothetical protein
LPGLKNGRFGDTAERTAYVQLLCGLPLFTEMPRRASILVVSGGREERSKRAGRKVREADCLGAGLYEVRIRRK